MRASRARQLREFQRRLLAWYAVHQRPLPWRRTRDPYKILVSEIMLQQTQVDRVIPKYRQFLRRYPTVGALARARAPELRKLWYPLGYNVRPLRLRRIAQRAMEEHAGRIPATYDGLLAMEGIGRYTAGAVLSFAFNQDAPIVDTNVARVLSRYFGLAGRRRPSTRLRAASRAAVDPSTALRVDPERSRGIEGRRPSTRLRAASRAAVEGRRPPAARRDLWALAQAVIPPGQGYAINQAMMDLGAMVCAARRPRCPACPLRRSCHSFSLADGPARRASPG